MLPVGWLARFEGDWGRERLLGPLTTYRIGGPAEIFLEPASVPALQATVRRLWRSGIPYRILGGGSNLLVSDRGVRGAVVSLAPLARVEAGVGTLVAEAGAQLHAAVTYAAERGLRGLEALAGIPGRVGGAIFGNAGSRHGAIGAAVAALDVLEPDGTFRRLTPGAEFFRYRASRVGDRIVVRAWLKTRPGDRAALCALKQEILRERRRTQPSWVGNAGCIFKNPPGDSAGRLIDAADCKGMAEGPVRVSFKHANFFENTGGGTEQDVLRLRDRVRERVRRVFGIELEMEVRRWP